MRFKRGWGLSSAIKKATLICLVLTACVGFVSSAWLLMYESSPTGLIISSEEILSYSDGFSMEFADVSNQSKTIIHSLNISNQNSDINMSLDLNTTISDVQDGCNNSGDVNVSMKYDDDFIGNGDKTITYGNHTIEVITSAKRLSCPQNVISVLTITDC